MAPGVTASKSKILERVLGDYLQEDQIKVGQVQVENIPGIVNVLWRLKCDPEPFLESMSFVS